VFLKPKVLIQLIKPMIKNTWIMIAGIVAGFNLLMVTANTAIASSDLFGSKANDLKQIDGRERTRVAGPGHPFSFVAQDVCDEDEIACVNVWGSGYFNTDRDQITSRGNFERSTINGAFIGGFWSALDLISGSDKDVTFKARAGRSTIGIMIDEGDKKNPAQVCVYGELVGIANPDNAICSERVRVSIK